MIDAALFPTQAIVSKKSKAKSSKNVQGKKTHLGVITNGPNAQQSSSETKDEQDNIVIQSPSVATSAINATKDLVPIDLAKGILGTFRMFRVVEERIKNAEAVHVCHVGTWALYNPACTSCIPLILELLLSLVVDPLKSNCNDTFRLAHRKGLKLKT
ncbi:hypothetical protein DFH29DRAFT_1071738 [Suillus ampliporus]|nr:hypothetical protein DFH29DRAFT_1071738 [Suillus ampliporus]